MQFKLYCTGVGTSIEAIHFFYQIWCNKNINYGIDNLLEVLWGTGTEYLVTFVHIERGHTVQVLIFLIGKGNLGWF